MTDPMTGKMPDDTVGAVPDGAAPWPSSDDMVGAAFGEAPDGVSRLSSEEGVDRSTGRAMGSPSGRAMGSLPSSGRRYRMLAFDLDGTLVNSEKEITPPVRAAIHEAISAGVQVVLASGRPLVGVAPVADALALDELGGYVLSNNGARVIEWRSKEVVADLTLPHVAVEVACGVAHEFGFDTLVYDDRYLYSERPEARWVEQERFNNSSIAKRVDDLAAFVTWEPNKVMVVGDPDRLMVAQEALEVRLAGVADVFLSEPYFIEIVPPGVRKGAAIAEIAERHGIPREEIIAVGDGYNAIPMLDYAGLAVAMDNSYPGVKEHADWIAPSNDEDGVVDVVKRFVL